MLRAGESWVKPVDLDLYCNHESETALHVAVRARHHAIASHLLAAGALPNLASRDTGQREQGERDQVPSGPSTCLVEAARNRDMGMLDLLLKYGARDDGSAALLVSAQAGDSLVMSKLLALRAHQDTEHGINKAGIAELVLGRGSSRQGRSSSASSLTYHSLCPSTPVMVNWHQAGGITAIRDQWLIDCAVRLNPKLRLSPKYQPMALHAITKLDLSNNELVAVPACLTNMQSLKFISLAGNKVEQLPETGYSLPWLEEMQMQDNRLDSVPPALFRLPSLQVLDLANNKLQAIPYQVWSAPVLTELNLSLNLLSWLPALPCPGPPSRHESQSSLVEGGAGSIAGDGASVAGSDPGSDGMSVVSEWELEDARQLEERVSQLVAAPLHHCNTWSTSLNIVDKETLDPVVGPEDCKLQYLNLSHNAFREVPACLPCLAPHLSRLLLSYNSLSSLGPLSRYPGPLKQLDLAHNQVASWPGESGDTDSACYAPHPAPAPAPESGRRGNKRSGGRQFCSHRRHIKLEHLRSLVLADNALREVALHCTSVFDSASSVESGRGQGEGEGGEETGSTQLPAPRPRLMFPALSKLDLSNNNIRVVPASLSELSNLSTLLLAGNEGITELPPELGLLTRLWNLTTAGCSLQEPLASMTASKQYKTMDIIGYLRSILEDAKPYQRMKLMVVGVQGIGKTTLLEQLRGEGGSYRRSKQAEHWARRMGNRGMAMKSGKGVSMSTVGVDIGDWTYERKGRGSLGPVTFRTWDFGGQQEYYTTHQYFLSRRSLYLVLWKIVDGEKGINEIQQWLINIQARAPNSPVLIVGTHQVLVLAKLYLFGFTVVCRTWWPISSRPASPTTCRPGSVRGSSLWWTLRSAACRECWTAWRSPARPSSTFATWQTSSTTRRSAYGRRVASSGCWSRRSLPATSSWRR